jgi:hypothetical protein
MTTEITDDEWTTKMTMTMENDKWKIMENEK